MTNRSLHLILFCLLLDAAPARPEVAPTLRYRGLPDHLELRVEQDIYIQGEEPIAGRRFSFELATVTDDGSAAIAATVEAARAEYSAHGNAQRLGTRPVTGRSFSLALGAGGRRVDRPEDGDPAAFPVDPMVTGGYSIAAQLVDALPALPAEGVAEGGTWVTETPIRSLEGWAWGSGTLTSRHRVIGIDRREDRIIVRVATEAEARLGGAGDGPAFTGDLTRTLSWEFDASAGRLLSLTLTQEARGSCPLPKGDVSFRQQSRLELGPAAAP